MLKDEMSVLKSMAAELDKDTIVLATYQNHVDYDEHTGKKIRGQSKYRWLARVMLKEDVKKMIDFLYRDENRLGRWKWPNDPSGFYCAPGDSQNSKVANWLENKIKPSKLMPFDTFLKRLKGWEPKTNSHAERYNLNAAWAETGYKADNGDMVDLTDKDALLKHVGQNLARPK